MRAHTHTHRVCCGHFRLGRNLCTMPLCVPGLRTVLGGREWQTFYWKHDTQDGAIRGAKHRQPNHAADRISIAEPLFNIRHNISSLGDLVTTHTYISAGHFSTHTQRKRCGVCAQVTQLRWARTHLMQHYMMIARVFYEQHSFDSEASRMSID